MEEQPKKRDYLLPMSILISGILISGSIVYLVGSNNQGGVALKEQGNRDQLAAVDPNAFKISGRDVILGDPNAPVSYVEYGDYQCPFCARLFTDTEPLLRENYVKIGKVKMVYRNFSFLGPESFAAAEASECAKDQQKFWAYHDAIYNAEHRDDRENNGNLNRDLFLAIAKDEGLDVAAFTSCIDAKKYADAVKEDTANGQALGVNSTPTVFVNDYKIAGAQPYEQFASVIDTFLKTP